MKIWFCTSCEFIPISLRGSSHGRGRGWSFGPFRVRLRYGIYNDPEPELQNGRNEQFAAGLRERRLLDEEEVKTP